jgi:WD40 repeat protein
LITVEKIDTFSGHKDCVYTLVPSHDPHIFYSSGGDGLVVKWDIRRPDLGELIAQIPATVYALCYDETRQQLWAGQNYNGVHLLDPHTKQELKSLSISPNAIFDIQLSRLEAFIALADGTIIVMDINSFTVKKLIRESDKSVRCMAINPLQNELAVGYSDNTIKIIDLQTYQVKQNIEAHANSVFTLQYSPDYQWLLSGSRDAHLKIWEVGQHYQLKQQVVAHLYALNHIAFSPNGNMFATCSMDKSVKIWDWNGQQAKLLKVIDKARHAGHATSVNKLLWLPQCLISASDDRRLSLWKVSSD